MGTCLVYTSCVVAFVACEVADKFSVYVPDFIEVRLCTGMDEARALVRALCNSSVSPMSSPLLHA